MQQSPAERLCVPSQAVVSSVDPGGLAEAAGFKVGDVIISMVSPLATVANELAPEVLKPLEPGMVCTVTVRRDVIAPTSDGASGAVEVRRPSHRSRPAQHIRGVA